MPVTAARPRLHPVAKAAEAHPVAKVDPVPVELQPVETPARPTVASVDPVAAVVKAGRTSSR